MSEIYAFSFEIWSMDSITKSTVAQTSSLATQKGEKANKLDVKKGRGQERKAIYSELKTEALRQYKAEARIVNYNMLLDKASLEYRHESQEKTKEIEAGASEVSEYVWEQKL